MFRFNDIIACFLKLLMQNNWLNVFWLINWGKYGNIYSPVVSCLKFLRTLDKKDNCWLSFAHSEFACGPIRAVQQMRTVSLWVPGCCFWKRVLHFTDRRPKLTPTKLPGGMERDRRGEEQRMRGRRVWLLRSQRVSEGSWRNASGKVIYTFPFLQASKESHISTRHNPLTRHEAHIWMTVSGERCLFPHNGVVNDKYDKEKKKFV